MAQLEFCDKHNMVAYLVKSESSEGFDEIIDFLTSSHIYYALTENPIIFVSLIEQFWETAVLSTTEEGLQAISATIDGHEKLITEDSLRRHLKLDDAEGISSLSNEEIFEHLAHMGYVTNSESLTFFKGHFSPQWKFFIHTILHCLSSKKTAWDQFSSNIATTLICLATSRRFNFSKFIFEAMVKNLDSPHKFLLYPRFIQLLLNKQQRLLLPHTRTYPTPTLTSKLFSNMRRASKGYSGVVTPLFESTTSIEEPKNISQALQDESWVEAMIEAIRLFLAFTSYMGFNVYQMDVKSAFLYGAIEEEVYVHQPLGFVDPAHPNLKSIIDKYVADILKKFDFWSIRTATTPIESNKPLVKDEDGKDVDVYVYRSMIGSLMYLTASRPIHHHVFAVVPVLDFKSLKRLSNTLNAAKRIHYSVTPSLINPTVYGNQLGIHTFELEASLIVTMMEPALTQKNQQQNTDVAAA
ncbi:putative ribonuclease H-like domain-containing protein [Tanacetum coccineum]|uniref:Ribonuclease H-like domain-containing protein n=1 Tax=Tanacetum coccineum TaxID=301880 RepID=A0ABQ5ENM9_9ASTR